MRKLLLGVLCLVVSTAAFAQHAVPAGRVWAEPQPLEGVHIDAGALYHQWATMRSAKVASEGPSDAFLFAVVGNAAGANGTYFRSEVTLVNNDTTFSQPVAIIYFPAGNTQGCNNYVAVTKTLAPNSFYTYNNFVGDQLLQTGLGAVVVLGVTSGGNLDTTANIDGFSRIWTPVAGFQGTASQSFPAVAISGYPGVQYMYGLHTDSGFRSNVFIFNYNPSVSNIRRFTLNFVGSNNATGSATLDVYPCALGLYSIQGNYASTSLSVVPPDSQAGWFAFGSSNDNLSGDNWSVAARPDGIH